MNGQRQHRSDKSCEWAALAALDALTPEESAAYQEHLKGGCPVCEAAVRSFEEVAGQLGAASPPVRPSALLKGRLMTRISEGAASNAPRDWGPTNGPTTGQPRFSRFVISSLGTEESQTRPGAKSTSWGRWLSAAAVFFVVCAGLWMAVQTRPAPYDLDRAAQETYIDSLYAQVAAAIRVGLGDHVPKAGVDAVLLACRRVLEVVYDVRRDVRPDRSRRVKMHVRRFNGRLETDPRKLEDLRSAILADRAREFLAARTLENILHASEHKICFRGSRLQ